MLATLIRPDAGTARVLGHDVVTEVYSAVDPDALPQNARPISPTIAEAGLATRAVQWHIVKPA